MSAWCSSCKQRVEVKKLKGKAPCCGYFNCLIKLPVVERTKRQKKAEVKASG